MKLINLFKGRKPINISMALTRVDSLNAQRICKKLRYKNKAEAVSAALSIVRHLLDEGILTSEYISKGARND